MYSETARSARQSSGFYGSVWTWINHRSSFSLVADIGEKLGMVTLRILYQVAGVHFEELGEQQSGGVGEVGRAPDSICDK